jgi:uncharacterized RDD family membrane protein YckC
MTLGVRADSGITLGLASRWARLFGQMIDGSFAAIPTFLAAVISQVTGATPAPLIASGIVWACFYFFFADGRHEGQSFAKQWLGIRVVDARTGAPCTFWQSFGRNVFTIFGPLDWIFIFGERRQRLGDKVAGTIVVIAD